MEIIPALNCLDEESLGQWIVKAGEFLPAGRWIHLDISDGNFTPTKTWNESAHWQELAGQYGWNLEVHLMVEKPEEVIQAWLAAGAKRVLVHVETINRESLTGILETVAESRVEAMLSSNPDTPIDTIRPYLRDFTRFQVLAVYPGRSGQKFLPAVLEKISLLRALRPYAKIEVDGGINAQTAALAKEAGADFVVAASYIFWSENPGRAYEELQEVISG